MSLDITPSKQVSAATHPPSIVDNGSASIHLLTPIYYQAASAIESLNMESPVKKLDLGVANKENKENEFHDPTVATLARDIDAKHAATKEIVKAEEPVKIPDLRAEELEEPILKENPHRFVLFPIQYHEVRDAFSPQPHALSGLTLTPHNTTDMADVQEARGFFLDRRGDRFVQGSS